MRLDLQTVSLALGAAALALFLLGPAAASQRWLAPERALGAMLFGCLIGAVAVVVSLVSLLRGGGWQPTFGFVLGLVPAGVLLAFLVRLLQVPRINDVTTNLEDPPGLARRGPGPGVGEDAARYPSGFVESHRQAYGDLSPLELDLPVAAAFDRVVDLARKQDGWGVTSADRARRIVAVEATSRVFGFVDDVTIRVTPAAGGSRIDLRSRSRVGRSDLGANAARIRGFLDGLRTAGSEPDQEG